MRGLIVFLACLLISSSAYGTAGFSPEIICSGDTVPANWANSTSPVWKVVFVRFPQGDEGGRTYYPNWMPWMEAELHDYLVAMSRGLVIPQVEVVRDPANPSRPWTADHEASFYAPQAGRGPWGCFATNGACNVEIMTKIHNAYPPSDPNDPATYFWHTASFVSIIQYDNAFACRCGIGGVGGSRGLDVGSQVPGFVEGADQRGYTSHLYLVNGPVGAPQVCASNPEDDFGLFIDDRVAAAQAHEWGHALGFYHSPNTGNSGEACVDCGSPPVLHGTIHNPPPQPSIYCVTPCGGTGQPLCDPLYMNIGSYSIMRGVGASDGRPAGGPVPFHPIDLASQDLTWRTPDSTITTNVRGFHIPQVRDPSRGKVYYVKPQNSGPGVNANQRFLMSNHQGAASSRFDAKYGEAGLLLWHILPGYYAAWDVETPRGKDGNGLDPLERDWCVGGDADDLYDGSLAQDNFSSTTNPTSYLYASPYRNFDPQTIVSSVGIEKIRHPDPGSPNPLDMVVDIYVDPTQYVTYPNGGEFIPKKQPWTTKWKRREFAGITSVDISLLKNGTPIYTQYGWPSTDSSYVMPAVNEPGNDYQVRVKSYDAQMNAYDESDTCFTVWGIDEGTIQEAVTQDCDGAITFDISWSTTVPTDGWDSLLVYPPGGYCVLGTPQVARAASQGMSHHVVWQGTCQSGGWSYVLKSAKGTGVATSFPPCRIVNVTECWTETTEVPSVIDASMVGWASLNPDPGFMTLHFFFGTTQCATEFEVQYRPYGTSNWTTLTCASPSSSCIFNANKTYERTQGYSPCEATRFRWRAKAKNWNGWQPTYSAEKSFWAYCLQEP